MGAKREKKGLRENFFNEEERPDSAFTFLSQL